MRELFEEKAHGLIIKGQVPEDYLKVFVDVIKTPEFHTISRQEFLSCIPSFLDPAKIDVRVVDEIIKLLKAGEASVLQRRILQGEAPVPGQDGKLVILVQQLATKPHPQAPPDKHADLAELHLFDNISKGQIVGRVYPPKAGVNGIDVLGRPIAAISGKPAPKKYDDTIDKQSAPDGGKEYEVLVALHDGCLVDTGHSYSIRSQLQVQHDLDFRWGNIDFVGKITVNGDVMPGFDIKARKGIDIRGSVRGGSLIASEGDIVVHEYAYGGAISMIMAGKTFSATVVQEVQTEVIGDIYIRKEANNSKLRTAGMLYMPDALLVGGEVLTVGGVEAKIIGSDAGSKTLIHLVSDIEMSLEYSKILIEIEVLAKQLKTLQLQLGPLVENPDNILELKEPLQSKMTQLYVRYGGLSQQRRILTEKKIQMVMRAKMNMVLQVNFHRKMYDGVVVDAGGKQFAPDKPIDGPASLNFDLRSRTFSLGPLKPLRRKIGKAS